MKKFVIAILFLTALASAGAQTSGIQKVFNLKECIDSALSKNPNVISAGVGIDAAGTGIQNARAAYIPSVSGTAGFQQNLLPKSQSMTMYDRNGSIVGTQSSSEASSTFSAGVSASVPVFDGFKRETNIDIAENSLESMRTSLEKTKKQLVIQIYRNYFDVVRKSEIVKVRKENLENGKNELDNIRAKYEAGLTHVGPVYAQEAEIGSREFDLVSAQNDLDLAKSQLLINMGFTPDYSAEFDGTDIPSDVTSKEINDFKSQFASQDSGIQSALENRIEIKSDKLNIDAAKIRLNSAQSMKYPTVSASANYNWTQNSDAANRMSYFNLNLSYPIFDNYSTKYQVETAQVNIQKAELERFITEQDLRNSVKTAILSLTAAEKQIEISDRALKSAKLNYDTYKERFNVGNATITEYLDANSKYITAQVNRVNAVFYYRLYQKETLYAVGQL